MSESVCPDVLIHVCQNCLSNSSHLPRQWVQDGLRVVIREVPCSGSTASSPPSGKTDAQYLFHALENGSTVSSPSNGHR